MSLHGTPASPRIEFWREPISCQFALSLKVFFLTKLQTSCIERVNNLLSFLMFPWETALLTVRYYPHLDRCYNPEPWVSDEERIPRWFAAKTLQNSRPFCNKKLHSFHHFILPTWQYFPILLFDFPYHNFRLMLVLRIRSFSSKIKQCRHFSNKPNIYCLQQRDYVLCKFSSIYSLITFVYNPQKASHFQNGT